MSQLRILHVINALETGGTETFLSRLLEKLPRDRFRSMVACMGRPGHMGGRIRAQGVALANLGLRRGLPMPGAVKRLIGLIDDFRPDVVQTWLYQADLLGLIAVRLSVEVPLVWNLRCTDLSPAKPPLLTKLTAWTCARLSRLPEAIVANSEAARDLHLARGYKPRELLVLDNGVDPEVFRPDAQVRAQVRKELGVEPDAPLVGLVARFEPLKDHAGFCAAAAKVAQALPRARFLFCGTGTALVNRELRHMVRQSGLQERAILAGHRQDAPRVMAALDVLCSASRSESFPNTLIEAMSCGVPCAATNTGDTARILGDTGRTIPAGDPGALAQAMTDLLSLPAEAREAMGRRCRERVLAHFSLDAAAEAYAGLYERLAARQ